MIRILSSRALPLVQISLGLVTGRLLSILLPPSCAACDQSVQQQGQLCAACFNGLNFITHPFCQRCGIAFASAEQAGRGGICAQCQHRSPVWHQARAALLYDDHTKRLILPLKHADKIELAQLLAAHMRRAGAALLTTADIIVPVPLHRRRLFMRRYNQAALLARAVARDSGKAYVPDALIRTRHTDPLGNLNAASRLSHVSGAFAIRAGRHAKIRGQRVVLIDDVLTSGATANACAEVLLDAGALQVDVLVAARVPDPAYA